MRAEIESIIKVKNLAPEDFRPLGIHEDWKGIEDNIYHSFCKLGHPTERPVWLWEHFRLDTFTIATKEQPYNYLSKLIDKNENIWLFANDGKGKFWFYEGKINAIITVIEESSYLNEFYLASKKYQWLICINHHDNLICTGQIMPDKCRKLRDIIE